MNKLTEQDMVLIRASEIWQPWLRDGWALSLTQDGGLIAYHPTRKQATSPAKLLDTVTRRLAETKYDYWLYTKYRQHWEK